MRHGKFVGYMLICWGIVAGWQSAELSAQEMSTALVDYVRKPDTTYAWKLRREGEIARTKYVELILTSQTWRDVAWKHQLFILRPAEVESREAVLFIAGGRWRKELEEAPAADAKIPGEAQLLAAVAARIKAPVAVLLQCPHQPIFGDLVEDAAIAYTFEQFMKTQDGEWPLLLPMVKSAVRGMDCVQEYCRKEWELPVETFTITGGSKRGWTTWLTGAVDRRAAALAPMVIDVLNMGPQMKHQLATWGEFSNEIQDYTDRGLQKQLASERGQSLNAIVDPYSYRKDLTQPKLILLGTNDRYWPLDACNLYWDGLEGEKFLLYVPNNGHGLKDYARVGAAIAALHQHSSGKQKLPQMNWKLDEDNSRLKLSVSSEPRPQRVVAWRATAPTRDFREARWEQIEANETEGVFSHELPRPTAGYAAMFGECVYGEDGLPLCLSTNVKIIAAESAGK